MPAPQIILELIERFERNSEAYKSGNYNETQVRREFIDPFFEALGWDVNNKAGNAEAYKDVIHEDAVKVSGVTKAPDYSFRIGGQRKYFVEAKQPSINIKDAPAPAFQVRRYAWSAKLPLSIVTDFDEFAVYDCRIRPDQKDKSDKARVQYYTYDQYIEKWDEIAAVFSKDAILKGSFDKFAESSRAKRGTSEVDNAFLSEIESWREMLARNIALRNTLTVRELNDSVQRIIDRIIFLRIAEDRGIEDYGALRSLGNGNNIYGRLQELFYKADDRYNSGLFHFRNEKDQAEPPDKLTPDLKIDDKPLKDILKTLYYPDSPYEFSVLPADILGQVYEQFLGKVIRLTSDHRAVVEDKPEVKKAGGVFYTPTYIVDYIVKNTVGKILEGKNPKKAESLRILDPACGSGSFLLGAYQYLLDWHLKWYSEDDPEKHAKAKRPILYKGQGNAWHLTTTERKRILLNNIYGVDIDTQAVEVTKLSLLLKVLEDETDETLNRQRKLFHERALPNLGGNIKCGNSLIGPDFFEGKQMALLDNEEAQRINVFDWQVEFPEIFKAGGFDAVIGNPPYVRPQNIAEETKKILWTVFPTFVAKSDMYSCFMEKGLTLIKQSGLFSFIVPQTWTSLESFTKIREFFIHNGKILRLVQLPKKVFANATVETCIFIIERRTKNDGKENTIFVDRMEVGGALSNIRQFSQREIEAAYLYNFQLYGQRDAQSIISKVSDKKAPLSDFVRSVYGFKTADDDQFIHAEKKFNESKPFIRSAGIHRYWTEQPVEYVWYVPQNMIKNRKTARPGEQARFEAEKIIVARMGKSLVASYDAGGLFVKDAMLLLSQAKIPSMKYLLGIINSRLLTYYYQKFFITIDVLKNALLSLPIKSINYTDPADKNCHDQIVQLVEQMLALNKQLPEAKTSHEQTLIQRQIDATDKQIDKLVYELYELTEDEIKIVEGN
ncbi:MAG: N-6 DNA methylase [Smithella sp.]